MKRTAKANRSSDRPVGCSTVPSLKYRSTAIRYISPTVKHFKFVPAERGKRRLHKKPSRTEIVACRPWLLAELAAVQPDLVVLLGAVAAQSLLGASFKVTERRGQVLDCPTG
jgi:uracil-DNA glycosylase